jgi:hypothetical protein
MHKAGPHFSTQVTTSYIHSINNNGGTNISSARWINKYFDKHPSANGGHQDTMSPKIIMADLRIFFVLVHDLSI